VKVTSFNPKGVAAQMTLTRRRHGGCNPFRVDGLFDPFTQGSSFLATLGFVAESLLDSRKEHHDLGVMVM
jgi:hypothetical protein